MFEIASWYNNYQAPCVLMIDDLSDAYIGMYEESYKNDWGYLCDQEGSSYYFLKMHLLERYPEIKITYFVPWKRHNVINENCAFPVKKYALGEREEYTVFLKSLLHDGHELAHHGSDHGRYIDPEKCNIAGNWIHEWGLFESVEEGVKTTLEGVKQFKKVCDTDVVGGKYCGYISRENSAEIIDRCDFLYWCEKPMVKKREYRENFFGEHRVFSFPTSYLGNSFIRFTYLSGNPSRDRKIKFLKYIQPLYNLTAYYKLHQMVKRGEIIAIQEHASPSTTSGLIQSLNIVTDIQSLQRIFHFLQRYPVWYATCADIAAYRYLREFCGLSVKGDKLKIDCDVSKKVKNPIISVVNTRPFTLSCKGELFESKYHNSRYVVNIPIESGQNIFSIAFQKEQP